MKINFILKAVKFFLFLSLSMLIFSSCQMTEKLTINDNESGKISFQVDGSLFMQMMGKSLSEKGGKTKYDSIIHFKDVLEEKKDSIKKLSKEEQRKLKQLENFYLKIDMDTDAEKMNLAIFTEFQSVKEVNNMFTTFQDGFDLASKSNKKLPVGKQLKTLKKQNKPSTQTYYSYTKRRFKRITKILDPEKLKKDIDSLGAAKSMFSSSKYKLIYTFPKRIKNASINNAFYSADRKTITIEKGLIEYMSNPKVLDFSIEFER